MVSSISFLGVHFPHRKQERILTLSLLRLVSGGSTRVLYSVIWNDFIVRTSDEIMRLVQEELNYWTEQKVVFIRLKKLNSICSTGESRHYNEFRIKRLPHRLYY